MTRAEKILIEKARVEIKSTLAVYGNCDKSSMDVDARMDYEGLVNGINATLWMIEHAEKYESMRSTDAEIEAEKVKDCPAHIEYKASGVPVRPPERDPIGWLEAQAAPIGSGDKQRERVPAVESFDNGVKA